MRLRPLFSMEPSQSRKAAHEGIFLHVYARNCEVRRIGKAEAGEFLSRYHVLGSTSCRYAYGLFVSKEGGEGFRKEPLPAGTLVAVSTFSGARNIPVQTSSGERTIKSYEWVRYASLPDVRVAGGMGKTLRRFIEDVSPDDVMAYALVENWKEEGNSSGVKPIGDSYYKLGFEREGEKEFPGGKSIKFRLKLSY